MALSFVSVSPDNLRKDEEARYMTAYDIRLMQEKDIPQIAEIEKLVFPSPWSAAALKSELEDNVMANYLVLVEPGEDPAAGEKVLGYGGIWKIFDEGHITNIAVHPDYQGKKLGRFLLYAMMDWCRANGLAHMTLEVRPSNQRALALYKKTGFEEVGRRKGYYEENNEDAIIMWLHFDKEKSRGGKTDD